MKVEINAYGTTLVRMEGDKYFIANAITENMLIQNKVEKHKEADLYCFILDFFNHPTQDQVMIEGWLILKD